MQVVAEGARDGLAAHGGSQQAEAVPQNGE